MDINPQALILTLETLAANAWPAATVTQLDGWRLRYTHGVTRRANSVWPNQENGTRHLSERLAQVEAFYAAHQLPPRYQICPAACPDELDDRLAERGYCSVARTAVQITPLAKIMEQTQALRWFPTFDVTISEEFDEDWFAVYREIEHGDQASLTARRGILQRINHRR
jgi:N-acetylglutamate synthase